MTRSELYTLVWAEPVSTVGPRLGLSSAGLAKLCGRHDIPIPTRGFWARLAAGQTPARQALPAQATDEVIPRFKALDDSGAPSPADALPVEWNIPASCSGPSLRSRAARGLRPVLHRYRASSLRCRSTRSSRQRQPSPSKRAQRLRGPLSRNQNHSTPASRSAPSPRSTRSASAP